MKIAFVTETVPFPPRNGKELPTAIQIAECAKHFDTTLIVLVGRGDADFDARIVNVPPEVRRVVRLDVEGAPGWRKALEELLLLAPSFALRGYDYGQVRDAIAQGPFDVVWLSPLGGYGLVQFCRWRGLALSRFMALGLNDSLTHASIGNLRAVLKRRTRFRPGLLLQALRLPLLWLFERRLAREADLVHVQTTQEAARVRAIAGAGRRVGIVVAPNGRKESLTHIEVTDRNSDDILLMTHMSGPRGGEATWFLTKVWPIIRRRHSTARLLLGGTPPSESRRQSLEREGIVVLGHVERLEDAYSRAAVAVVPILHSSGCVNRVLDAFAAGVPLVTTAGPLSTIAGAVSGVHALTGESAEEFAEAVVSLLRDPHLRASIAERAKMLAVNQPTWEESSAVIVNALRALVSPAPAP